MSHSLTKKQNILRKIEKKARGCRLTLSEQNLENVVVFPDENDVDPRFYLVFDAAVKGAVLLRDQDFGNFVAFRGE